MKTYQFVMMGLGLFLLACPPADAFDSGSDGTFGPLVVAPGATVTNILPSDGIINATSVDIGVGGTLKFERNVLNTPVYILATTDIVVNGSIDVSGLNSSGSAEGSGGPGGFDGGKPGGDGIPAGAGLGPGAGLESANAAFGGPTPFSLPGDGDVYGSALLVPMVGGSGGGGIEGVGGGGGGGGIVLASSSKINLSGFIRSLGGVGSIGTGDGSGGGIRLVAPTVEGAGTLNVSGAPHSGSGRIRIDRTDIGSEANLVSVPGSPSIGTFMVVFLTPEPRIDIIEAAGQSIPEGTPAPVVVNLPFPSETNQVVVVQARDFQGLVPIEIVITPENGEPQSLLSQIDMSTGNPAVVTNTLGFPVNQNVRINAWTR